MGSCTLGELGVLGANPFRGGKENRAKDAKDAKVKGKKDEGTRYRDWPLPTHQLSRHPPAASVVAGLTEPGGPRHPRRPPTWMVKREGRVGFLTLGELGVLGANPFRGGGEETRAKDAKDAKVKGRRIQGLGCDRPLGVGASGFREEIGQ